MNIQNHIFKMNDNLDEINIWGETLFVCYILLINMEEFLLSYPHGYEGFHILCLGKTRKIKCEVKVKKNREVNLNSKNWIILTFGNISN